MNSGISGHTREAQIPVICEFLEIPFTGSGSWTAFITQDKYISGLIIDKLELPIYVPETILIPDENSLELILELSIEGRYIIKPNFEGASRGIDEYSVVDSREQMFFRANEIISTWGSIIIQRFIEGVDVSANLVCDSGGQLFPLEPLIINSGSEIFSDKTKSINSSQVNYEPLVNKDNKLSEIIKKSVIHLAKAFKFRDYARFDLRLDLKNNNIYFLEANLCPSFDDKDDFMNACSLTGLSYSEVFSNIIKSALRRST
jgi:D-alanine-D-alanine ligase